MKKLIPIITASLLSIGVANAKPVKIAVIDTGISQSLPLRNPVVSRYDYNSGFSDSHGSYVTSIIDRSVNVPVEFISINASPSFGSISMSRINNGIDSAIIEKADIIQISIYGYYPKKTVEKFKYAASLGIQIVFCAGNNGDRSPLESFAVNVPNVWIVGAYDVNGVPAKWSDYSRKQNASFVWMPGERVAALDSKGRAVTVDGTSFAAPLWTARLADRIYND